MRYGGVLQQIEAEKKVRYIVCTTCDVIYEDSPGNLRSSTKCPECGNDMKRGITREEAKELADDKYKELFS